MYETLLKEAEQLRIEVYERKMSKRMKGLYNNKVIWINSTLSLNEKICVLAEELGHYYTSAGNILNQNKLENRKQEQLARDWAYKRVVPLYRFIEAIEEGVRNIYEFANFAGVTEEFLYEAIEFYKRKYGLYVYLNGYTINFDKLVASY